MIYDYKIEYCCRKSVCLSISSENEITVRCPYRMPISEIEKFIASKQNWINKKLKANAEINSVHSDVKELKAIYVNGKKLKLVFGDKVSVEEDAIYIKSEKDIKKMFCKAFNKDFLALVDNISANIGLYANSYKLRSYKSRWGCCDANKNVNFNFVLLMLPSELQNYVIVHELCHTVYLNHSQSFWNLVKKFVPYHKILRRELKKYNFLIDLYC